MAIIPRTIYDICENMIRRREDLIEDAEQKLEEAREAAYEAKRAKYDENGGGRMKGIVSDPTEKSAEMVIKAEEELEQAQQWQRVFFDLDRIFENRAEATAINMIYKQNKQQLEVAETLHYDRQTIRRFRDTYICHCALLAAERGLLKVYKCAAVEATGA